jgi:PAS domain-containing protein
MERRCPPGDDRAAARAAEMAGGVPADFVGRSQWEAFPESTDSTFGRTYRRAMEERRILRVADDYPALGKSFQVTAYPDAQGLTLVVTDITETVAATKSLRESEERLKLARAAAGLGLWGMTHTAGPPGRSLSGLYSTGSHRTQWRPATRPGSPRLQQRGRRKQRCSSSGTYALRSN